MNLKICIALISFSLSTLPTNNDKNKVPLKLAIIFLEIKEPETFTNFALLKKHTPSKNFADKITCLEQINQSISHDILNWNRHELPKPPLRFPDIKHPTKKSSYDYLAKSLSPATKKLTIRVF